MKKFFVYISLAIMLLSNVSCVLLDASGALLHVTLAVIAAPMNRYEAAQRRIQNKAREASSSAESAQMLYSGKEFSTQYRNCLVQTYIMYAEKNDEDTAWYYTAANGQRIKEEWELYYVMVMITESEQSFRDTPEKASPYNYAEFVEFVKNNNGMYKKYPIETMNVLQDWVKMQYEQCGVHVYTMEERCAAMKAVDIETEWCKK